ncbi:MAG: hypothetical protein IJ452_09265 [Butyricicoccus sp.]|nr:hypothetical protein [Butyricicoccus sp.]MBQ8586455.1 hypothetical protein [Butyricicoccus sp.]
MKRYENLGDMLKNDPEIFNYYTGLPIYVRSMIARRSNNVRTEEQLHAYAENLMQGDR